MTHPIEGLVLLDGGSRWVRMTDPVAVVEARRPRDVAAAIQEVEAQVRARGCHALGFLRYEAGGAFGLTVAAGASSADDQPLVWFALFAPANVHIVPAPRAMAPYELGPPEPSISRGQFHEAFRTIHQHLADGDTYQVNYTFRLRCDFSGDPLSLFADLVGTQRGRHAAFIRNGHHAICSASPELFFSYDGASLVARPMKGTARRGRTLAEDDEWAARLLESAKERAENVMVVDMVRNDLGRVADYGSVDVPALFTLEPYPNVWQLTSTVTARAAAPLEQVIAALFPSASITGAPKVRTMEIIAALERAPRGVYTGAIGYLAPDGGAQFNVAIRTAIVDVRAASLEFGVGCGVVWDSDPDREYDECLLKGAILGHRPQPFELLETMRWTPEEGMYLLERHLARLAESARYFRFVCPLDDIRAALVCAVAAERRSLRVRLLLSENGRVRTEQTPLESKEGRLRVRLAAHPVDASDIFLFHKTTNRAVYEEARRTDCDDVILWNRSREVTEATMANVVVAIDGRRITPPVACGLLAGTFRAELLAAGDVVEAVVPIERLTAADAIWLVNSVRGWCPAVLVTD